MVFPWVHPHPLSTYRASGDTEGSLSFFEFLVVSDQEVVECLVQKVLFSDTKVFET